MTTATMPAVRDTADLIAGAALQTLLPDLIALTLDAKQAHWNVTGPAFLPLHALTDELAADTRLWADRVAERAVALGNSVDGRPAALAYVVTDPLPSGWLPDHDVVVELGRRIDDVLATARYTLDAVADVDAVAHDITVNVMEGLGKYRWMLRAQACDTPQ